MKTLRMIGMALFAMVMCVNLSSCSDDDDDYGWEESEILLMGGSLECFRQSGSVVYAKSETETFFDLRLCYYNSGERFDSIISFIIPTTSLVSGEDITSVTNTLIVVMPGKKDTYTSGDGELMVAKSGKLKITKITSEKVTVKFDDLLTTFNDGTNLKLDGTVSYDIQE